MEHYPTIFLFYIKSLPESFDIRSRSDETRMVMATWTVWRFIFHTENVCVFSIVIVNRLSVHDISQENKNYKNMFPWLDDSGDSAGYVEPSVVEDPQSRVLANTPIGLPAEDDKSSRDGKGILRVLVPVNKTLHSCKANCSPALTPCKIALLCPNWCVKTRMAA